MLLQPLTLFHRQTEPKDIERDGDDEVELRRILVLGGVVELEDCYIQLRQHFPCKIILFHILSI